MSKVKFKTKESVGINNKQIWGKYIRHQNIW